MPDDDQPTIPRAMPQGSQPSASGMWQAPSVEQMQAVLPQYEVLEILGRGGMGAVYKARQRSLKRLVAIKILPLEVADDELKFAERFQNEAQTMAAMNHPAIVSVYDFGETRDGLLYFVMEFVDGTDVQKMIQTSGRLTGDYALTITAHVCDALAYAHKRGVIHRDIKPANILIDQEGHIKVADFGLAKMHDPSVTSGLTRSNVAMGTPDYVAPEVLTTGLVVDHRADLYAVGVMLYQMLTGEVPRGMFKLPSQKGIGSDPRFDEIICKAMEYDREERYQSAGDVRQALEAIRTTPLEKKVVSALAESGDARLRLKSKLLYVAVAVVLLVAMFFILGDKPKPSASPAFTATGLPSIAQGKTIDLLALVDVKRDTVAGEWSRDGDDLVVKAAKPDANGTPRLQLPYQPPEEYDFEIEFTPESGDNKVLQTLSAYQRPFTWQVDVKLNAGMKTGFTQIDGNSLVDTTDGTAMRPSFLTNGQRHRSTVEVRRTGLRGLLDGQQVVSWGSKPESYQALDIHPNDALRDTLHLGIGSYDRAVRFHKATVREITGLGKVDAIATGASALVEKTDGSPPVITNWQDVTAATRDAARKIPGLVVEQDAIRSSSKGSVNVPISPRNLRDCAVRLNHSGGGQIALRSNADGFLFVLCQSTQTIFKRYDKDLPDSVSIGPSRLHAPGFDYYQPHELVAVIQGTTIRAWVDRKFVGEAQDTKFTEGTTQIGLFPSSVVTKVEIAELPIGKPQSNATWNDWLGPKLATGTFGPPDWKVEKDGLTSEKPISGRNILTGEIRDAAMRVTYDLRDSGGIQVAMREHQGNLNGRELYVVDDTGVSLYIARMMPDGTIKKLVNRNYPNQTPRAATRTLEFRCLGETLTATVTGATTEPFVVTATDTALQSGPVSVALKKGVLLKKVETQILDTPR